MCRALRWPYYCVGHKWAHCFCVVGTKGLWLRVWSHVLATGWPRSRHDANENYAGMQVCGVFQTVKNSW